MKKRPLKIPAGFHWLFLLALGVVLFIPLISAETETQKAVDEQKEAERELKNLETKIVRIAEKLKEIHPYYAGKLLQAREMMKKDLLLDDIQEIITALENGLSGQALDKTNELNESLIKLLAFLEDKMDSKNAEEKIRKLEELMKTLKNIQQEEQQLFNDTEKFNRDRYGDIDDLNRSIDELLLEQQKLNDLLKKMEASSFRQQLEKALEKAAQLRQKQSELNEQTGRLDEGDLKTVNDLMDRLNSLIKRQSAVLKETAEIPESEQGLKNALDKVDRLLAVQKLLKDTKPAEAGFDKTAEQQLKLADEIAGLRESLKKIPVELPEVTDENGFLPQAERKAREAGMGLEDEIEKTAAEAQAQAFDKLERTRAALTKKLDDLAREREKTLDHLAEEQDELAEEARRISPDIKNFDTNNQPEAAPVSRQVDESAGIMIQAGKQLSNHNPETARGLEEKALEKLKEAYSSLSKLQNRLAGPKKDDFKKLEEQQSDLARQTQDLLEHLQKMAESLPEQPEAMDNRQRQKMQNAVNGAAQDSREAIQSMNRAQSELGQNNLPQAKDNQRESADALKLAEEKLAGLKDDLAKQDKSEILKQLAKHQEELQKKTGELNKKINELAGQEPRETLKKGLNQAGTHTNNAGGEMKQSAGDIRQSAKANQQGDQASAQQHQESAQGNQEKAISELTQARQELEKVKNRDMTEEEKRRLEKLAERQKEIEKKTQELAQESEKSGEKTPAQALKNGGQKMNSASRQMGQGQSSQAQEDEDEALKELQRAYEQLAQKAEELSAEEALRFIEKLEKTLAEVMNKQQNINKETVRLEIFKQKNGVLSREEQINLKKLAGDQKDLGRQTDVINQSLLKEHSVVFSWVLKTVVDDMNLSGELLAQHQRTDDYTQGLQEDIVHSLKELLDALKKEKKKKKAMSDSGGGGGGGGKMPLLSDVAELKMLKIMQEGLKRKTEEFRKNNIKEGLNEFDQLQKTMLRRLSDEQGTLADLLDSFTKKLAKESEPKHK